METFHICASNQLARFLCLLPQKYVGDEESFFNESNGDYDQLHFKQILTQAAISRMMVMYEISLSVCIPIKSHQLARRISIFQIV